MEKSKKIHKKNKHRYTNIVVCIMTTVLVISCILAIPCSASPLYGNYPYIPIMSNVASTISANGTDEMSYDNQIYYNLPVFSTYDIERGGLSIFDKKDHIQNYDHTYQQVLVDENNGRFLEYDINKKLRTRYTPYKKNNYYLEYDTSVSTTGIGTSGENVRVRWYICNRYDNAVLNTHISENAYVCYLESQLDNSIYNDYILGGSVRVTYDAYQYKTTSTDGDNSDTKLTYIQSVNFESEIYEATAVEMFNYSDMTEVDSSLPVYIQNITIEYFIQYEGTALSAIGGPDDLYVFEVRESCPITRPAVNVTSNDIMTYNGEISNFEIFSGGAVVDFENINIVSWITSLLDNVLSAEIIPNVSFGGILWLIASIALFFFCLKVFLGG